MSSFFSNMKLSHRMIAPNLIFLIVLGLAVYVTFHSKELINQSSARQIHLSELQTGIRSITMNIQKFMSNDISFEQLKNKNEGLLNKLAAQKEIEVFVMQMRSSLFEFEELSLRNKSIEKDILKLSNYSLEQSNEYINAVTNRLADDTLKGKVTRLERQVISGALRNSSYQYIIQHYLEKIKYRVNEKKDAFNFITMTLANVDQDVKNLSGTPFEKLPINAKQATLKIQKHFQALVANLENQNVLRAIVQTDINEILASIDRLNREQITTVFSQFEQYLNLIALIIMISVVLTIGFNVFTASRILKPINNLVEVLGEYGKGDLEVRAQINSTDEIGFFAEKFNAMLDQINDAAVTLKKSESTFRSLFSDLQSAINTKNYSFRFKDVDRKDLLAQSLNDMLKTLENAENNSIRQDWLKTGQADLNNLISGERNLDVICQKAITFIAKYIGANVGTFFVKQQESTEFSLISSYAFKERKGFVNRIKPGEGIVGQSVLEKEALIFSEVPQDYLKIESSLGYVSPKVLIALPLVFEDDVNGVIELGMLEELSDHQIQFLESAGNILAVGLNAALFSERLERLLEMTKQQSLELKEQQEELKVTNEELEEQTATLKESEAKLQLQQEELQASNEELEEKTEILESQKDEIEKNNATLKIKQKEVEEKAEQLELATKYKSEFLANMSHELRTPLNSLLILAKLLAENEEKNLTPDQVDSAASIHKSGQNLLRLINDVLDLSKIEANKIELNISTSRIEHLCTNYKTEFSHMAKEKGLNFDIEVKNDLPKTIVTDEHRLNQIIRNLVGNAIKFTEKGGINLIFSRPEQDVSYQRKYQNKTKIIAISVSDTGQGIPEGQLQNIFHAFKQVDGSISRTHGGTGLGLSISKELAALIGGELKVESNVEKGTIFTLYLPEIFSEEKKEVSALNDKPELKVPEVPVTTPENKDRLSETTHSKTMLIIEDDNEFASILANFFKKNGYNSIIASNGEEGIKYVMDYQPTAIILDIGLPGVDGWTILNELKTNPDTRHIPVHIMSAFDETRQGLEKGAVGYLTKPVDLDGFQTALKRIEDVLENSIKELLIVEDDKDLQNTILKLMKTNDIHSVAADTGKKALELLKTKKFDCMILDLGLPDISGFKILDHIEKDPRLKNIPIIIYTGRNLSREEAESLEMYSSSIVLKNASSMERLLDETALFMHRVESDMPKEHQQIIQNLREPDSILPGKKVLLVDDDMRNAFALNKFLKSKGMDVKIANNGKKALEFLEQEGKPDIVLMDIMMPMMDGYEAIKRIRGQKKFRDLPILALTAKAMQTDREECIKIGANDYLSKPVDTSKLLAMLRVWLYS